VDDGISIQHQVPDCAPPTTAFKWIMCNVKNHIPRPFDASVVFPCECVGVEQLEFRHLFSPGQVMLGPSRGTFGAILECKSWFRSSPGFYGTAVLNV
jgi:hypothetical protein